MANHPMITTDPAILDGRPIIAGTQVPVDLILERLTSGGTTDQLLAEHPELTPKTIRAALDFATGALRYKCSH